MKNSKSFLTHQILMRVPLPYQISSLLALPTPLCSGWPLCLHSQLWPSQPFQWFLSRSQNSKSSKSNSFFSPPSVKWIVYHTGQKNNICLLWTCCWGNKKALSQPKSRVILSVVLYIAICPLIYYDPLVLPSWSVLVFPKPSFTPAVLLQTVTVY